MKTAEVSLYQPNLKAHPKNAIKLQRRAAKVLDKDILEIRKNLPDNKDAVVNKYFGQPTGDGPYDTSAADIAVGLGAIAVGLGLALL